MATAAVLVAMAVLAELPVLAAADSVAVTQAKVVQVEQLVSVLVAERAATAAISRLTPNMT